MHKFKKIVCTTLSCAMVLGAFAACSKSDKDDDKKTADDYEDVVESYLDNLLKYKLSKNEKLVVDGEDSVAEIDFVDSDNEFEPVLEAILTTASYEITDSEDGDKPEVTYELSVVDIEAVLDENDDIDSIDALVDAIEDSADDEDMLVTEEFSFTLVDEDDEWLIKGETTEDLAEYLSDMIDDIDGTDLINGGSDDETVSTEPTEIEPVATEPTETTVYIEPAETLATTTTEPSTSVSTAQAITGTDYIASYDYTEQLVSELASTYNASSYTPSSRIVMEIHLTLSDDGQFRLYNDPDQVMSSIADFYRVDLLPLMAEVYGMSASEVEALFEQSGTSIDQLIDEQLMTTDTSEVAMELNGTYVIDGNQILLTAMGSSMAGDVNGDTISLTLQGTDLGDIELVFNKVG